MKKGRLFGWIFAALWLGGIQLYIYLYEDMEVFWLTLAAWIGVFLFVFWKSRRRLSE